MTGVPIGLLPVESDPYFYQPHKDGNQFDIYLDSANQSLNTIIILRESDSSPADYGASENIGAVGPQASIPDSIKAVGSTDDADMTGFGFGPLLPETTTVNTVDSFTTISNGDYDNDISQTPGSSRISTASI